MPKINLLPVDLIPKGLTVRAVKMVNLVVVVGLVLFICSSVILIALFVINSVKLNSLIKNRDQLLVSIKKNQQAEQSLFLIRDRLSKIKTIEAQKSSGPTIKDIPQILSGIPASVALKTATFLPTESEIIFGTGDSSGITQLMTAMTVSKSFSTLNLNSFTYSNTKGYSLGFGIIK